MPKKQLQVTDQQVLEWTEGPVPEVLRRKILDYQRMVYTAKGIPVFHPFEPQKTHEILCGLNAIVDTLDLVIEWLWGDWESLEIEDDSDED